MAIVAVIRGGVFVVGTILRLTRRTAPPVARSLVTVVTTTVKTVPKVTRLVVPPIRATVRITTAPGRSYVRQVLTGPARPRIINPVTKVSVRDITVISRAAIQTRALPGQVRRFVQRVAIDYAPRYALIQVRRVIRDVASPYYTGVKAYQLYRLSRMAKGRANLVERVGDRYVFWSGRQLRRVKLQPKFRYIVRSYIRLAIVGTTAYQYKALRDSARALRDKIQDYSPQPTPKPSPVIIHEPVNTPTSPAVNAPPVVVPRSPAVNAPPVVVPRLPTATSPGPVRQYIRDQAKQIIPVYIPPQRNH